MTESYSMPSPEGATSRRQMSFHFVNAHPSSETESLQSRHFVRSHVGSWVWQQTKQSSRTVENDENDDRYAQDVRPWRDKAGWNTAELLGVGSATSSTSLPISTHSPETETSRTAPSVHNGKEISLPRMNNTLERSAFGSSGSVHSIDYISGGSLDPFQTYPSGFPSNFVNWCHKYCLYHEFPRSYLSGITNPPCRSVSLVARPDAQLLRELQKHSHIELVPALMEQFRPFYPFSFQCNISPAITLAY